MKRNVITLMTALIIILANSSIIAQDQKCDGDKERGEYLELTEEQKTKIKELKTDFMKKVLPLKNQLKEKKAHLNTLMTAEKTDMNAINKTIDEIGALKIQIMKADAAHKQEVRKLLNEEQRLKFDMRHSREKGKRGHHKGHKKERMHKEGCQH